MRDRYLRERERFTVTGVSRVSWWRYERDGRAPKRRRLGPGIIGWLESEIDIWVEDPTGWAERQAQPR